MIEDPKKRLTIDDITCCSACGQRYKNGEPSCSCRKLFMQEVRLFYLFSAVLLVALVYWMVKQ